MKSTIQVLMEDLAKQNGIPSVIFNHNTDLARIQSKLMAGTIDVGNTPADMVNGVFAHFESLENDPFQKEITDNIGELCSSLATKIQNVQNEILNVLKPEVTSYAKEIEEIAEQRLARNPYYSKEPDVELDTSYVDFDWSEIRLIGSVKEIIDYINTIAKLSSDKPNQLDMNLAISHLPMHKPASTEKVQNINLSIEKRAEIVDKLFDATGEKINKDNIRIAIKLVSDENTARLWANQIVKFQEMSFVNKTLQFAESIRNLYKTISVLEATNFDVSDITNNMIHANAKILKDYFIYMAYCLCVYRQRILNETLMLTDNIMNADLKDNLFKDGFTLNNVANHLYYLEDNKQEFPQNGIKLISIERNASNMAKHIEDTRNQKRYSQEAMRNKAYRMSIIAVLRNHIEDGTFIINNYNKHHALKTMEEKSNQITDMALEDVLYDIFVELRYNKTMIGVFYKRLSSSLIRMSINRTNITADDVNMVENGVVADFVIDFLSNFIERS